MLTEDPNKAGVHPPVVGGCAGSRCFSQGGRASPSSRPALEIYVSEYAHFLLVSINSTMVAQDDHKGSF